MPEEADKARHIFQRYLALGSVHALQTELAEQDIRTKSRLDANGVERGNAHFSRGALYPFLRNRIYLGEISHKGTAYPGDHDAIVEQSLFDRADALLSHQRDAYAAGMHVEEQTCWWACSGMPTDGA